MHMHLYTFYVYIDKSMQMHLYTWMLLLILHQPPQASLQTFGAASWNAHKVGPLHQLMVLTQNFIENLQNITSLNLDSNRFSRNYWKSTLVLCLDIEQQYDFIGDLKKLIFLLISKYVNSCRVVGK